MGSDVRNFVWQCLTCQQIKYEPKRPAGLLQPLPIPASPWKDLSLDFITCLPSSQGYTTILVVMDRFTKGAHFGVLPSTYTASKVASLFINMVCKLHGFPRSLVLDRDPVFVGRFWCELFTIHLPSLLTYRSLPIKVVDHLLTARQDLSASLQARFRKAQQTMKTQADSKCRDISYNVKDLVYVKLRPYRQTSLAGSTFHKLSKRYYGPFQITELIGTVAYRLALPPSSKIHNVFHCSILKPHHGPLPNTIDPLPPRASDNHPLIEPMVILTMKWDTTQVPPSLLVLV